jgi:predicted DNA-binding transcriptional regulator YafY
VGESALFARFSTLIMAWNDRSIQWPNGLIHSPDAHSITRYTANNWQQPLVTIGMATGKVGNRLSRAERLLTLIQILHRHRYPVSGASLAGELGVSLRTLYRDIASLQGQGAAIDGEPGLGYVLRPGFMLPPLMFSQEELEALVLGSRWVAEHTDTALKQAAQNAIAKIAAVLPSDLRQAIDASTLLIVPGDSVSSGDTELTAIRRAIRGERKLAISYLDLQARTTQRTIWPFALGFFERVRVVAAWCELRQDFRNFRIDRITALDVDEERYPRRRHALMKEWREREGMTIRQR